MENRVRLGGRAIQRIRHANRNHRARRQSHRLHHRRGRRRRRRHHLHRLLRSRRRPPGEEAEAAEAQPALLPCAAAPWRRWRRLCRARRRHHQIIDHRPHPIDRSTIRSRQRAGSVVVYLAVERSHPVGHIHLDILARQRRLRRDLGLNVTADLLVVSSGGGAGRRGRRSACWQSGCRAVLQVGTDSCSPTPAPGNLSEPPSGMLRRIRKSIFMGKSSVLDFCLRLLSSLTKETMQQARALCANHASHLLLPSNRCARKFSA